MSSPRFAIATTLFAIPLLSTSAARAQMQPTMPTPVAPADEDKAEGVAEQAPKTPGLLPTTPVLPPPKSRKKQFELIEFDGYFRWRGDWFKKFHLGFNDDPAVGGAPFPRPLACNSEGATDKPCETTLKAANIRLRVEPTINIDEKASVHVQADILDNLVLGSTPEGYFTDGTPRPGYVPISTLTDGQEEPQAGRNSQSDSIAVKRAWAEVMTPFGLLKFGRMPWHWGMGMVANAGGYDPIHGTYDLDSDYGDSVDRLAFSTIIPGTDLRGEIAMDWTSTSPSSAQTDIMADRYRGQAWDLDDNDDVNQWVFTISRLDSPTDFQNLLDDGETALNYGAFLAYRTHDWEQLQVTLGQQPLPEQFVRRKAKVYVPDVWFHLGSGDLDLELEAVAVLGSIETMTDFGINEEVDIRQYGAVGRLGYRVLDDDLNLQFEAGYASGDQWDNDPQGATHVSHATVIPGDGDTTISAFRFDFDYEIDLILFRELLGTVTNATYVKPSFAYDITKKFSLRGQGVMSWANVPVSTPGNSSFYGIELDGDLGYHNDGFFAGMSYGVLFPLGAMDHPGDDLLDGGPGFNYGANAGDASTAQTIQFRLGLQF